jgi:hypothetical protein
MRDTASLPVDRDIFRRPDARGVIVATERFVQAVRRLELDALAFHELPLR